MGKAPKNDPLGDKNSRRACDRWVEAFLHERIDQTALRVLYR